ncbi:MAG: PIN domain-containing protein [Chloroflexota bacterium]|nr:PIN domain-containing protein [Chloroflexota bacterium]
MKLLLDVNVFMDILERRDGWVESLAVVRYCQQGSFTGYISALTFPIIYFLRRRRFDENQARDDTHKIASGMQVIALTDEIIENSRESSLPDFEDAIQFFSAENAEVDYVVTRNKKHFAQEKIAVATPGEFLKATMPPEKQE